MKPVMFYAAMGVLSMSAQVLAAGAPPHVMPMNHAAPMPAAHVAAAPAATTTKPSVAGPAHTGQPNQSCGSPTAPNTPGNASQAPGSAFNPDGKAGTVYAGQQPQNSRNPASVSQYDVACSHQP
jgi:hypothetical protein